MSPPITSKQWRLDKNLTEHYCNDKDAFRQMDETSDEYQSEGFTVKGKGIIAFLSSEPGEEEATYFYTTAHYAPDSEYSYLSWSLLQHSRRELDYVTSAGKIGICFSTGKVPFLYAGVTSR
jgi:hypothetical protein